MDKSQLLERALDRYGVRFSPTRHGWQSVRCPNVLGHSHSDANPSARINLTVGAAHCLGCGLSGDGYNVVMAIEGVDFKAALALLGGARQEQESMWLI